MYLSHPVRRMRDDPAEGETVTLVVTAVDEAAAATLVDRLDDLGVVEKRLRFGAIRATVPQTRVGDVCALDGIEAVETGNTLASGIEGGSGGPDYDSTCR